MRFSSDSEAVLILALTLVWLVPSVGVAADPEEQPAVVRTEDGVVDDSRDHSRYLEFRIYTAQEGQRDRFLNYFEEQYLESQEEKGMRIWGQFRDLDTANHFVWMRGYRTMEERASSLMGFYMSAHWKETSPLVGEMLASAEHVHFLEPVTPGDALDDRLGRSPDRHQVGVIVVQLFPVEQQAGPLIERIRETLIPAYRKGGATTLGLFESSDEENNIPQLPFIEDEPVVVWLGSFTDRAAFEAARKGLDLQPAPFETFVLEPGPRSRLYHRGG